MVHVWGRQGIVGTRIGETGASWFMYRGDRLTRARWDIYREDKG